ncbi:hypothetical protein GCM10027043_47810 [Ferruginibacter profundus]
MTNHLHLIAKAKEGCKLSHIIRDFKKFTARSIFKAIAEEPESKKDRMLYRFEFAGKFIQRIENIIPGRMAIMLFILIPINRSC